MNIIISSINITAEIIIIFLTKETVAEAVPHACRLVPRPPSLDARREREVYSD